MAKFDIPLTPREEQDEPQEVPPPPNFENPWFYEWNPPQGYTFGPGAQDDEDEIEEDFGGREQHESGPSGTRADDDDEEEEDDEDDDDGGDDDGDE